MNMQQFAARALPDQSAHSVTDTPVIFVVDDDICVRESLERFIGREGWRARTFASTAELLEGARPLVPSCLVVDVTQRHLSGLELQSVLAGQPELPIIFITALADVPLSVGAVKAGACAFLTRPFTDEALLGA